MTVRLYYDKKWKKKEVIAKPRKDQLKCKHEWRIRVSPIANWGSVCRKCGICCRGGRL